MLERAAFIVYTHSDYADVCEYFFKQTERFFAVPMKKYIFTDKEFPGIPEDYTVVTYDDELTYPERVASCLSQVPEKHCLFQHEDMFLYNHPQAEALEHFIQVLDATWNDLEYVKLIKAGVTNCEPVPAAQYLYKIAHSSEYVFAIQPTLWRTGFLQRIYEEAGGNDIWEFEVKGTRYCREHNIRGAYCFADEPLRGMFHHDSYFYPFIATAIVKGKWNVSEYPELKEIVGEEAMEKRGTC